MEIQINNAVPVSTASVFDLNGSVILEHGGVCTRMEFDKVESMSLDTFRRIEMAKLLKDSNNLHVIRNAAEDEYAFILGDRVLRYKLTGCKEVDLESLLKELKFPNRTTSELTPGLPWPLVTKLTGTELTTITVSVPPTRRVYSCSSGCSFELPYWCPPIWFSLRLTQAGVFRGASLAVVKDFNQNYKDTTLYSWPMANVYRDGRICFGGANLTGINKATSDFEKLKEAMSCFFDGNYNSDLIMGEHEQNEVIRGQSKASADEYEEPYRSLLMECASNSSISSRYIIKVLWALRNPDGWKSLKLPRCTSSASGFCGW